MNAEASDCLLDAATSVGSCSDPPEFDGAKNLTILANGLKKTEADCQLLCHVRRNNGLASVRRTISLSTSAVPPVRCGKLLDNDVSRRVEIGQRVPEDCHSIPYEGSLLLLRIGPGGHTDFEMRRGRPVSAPYRPVKNAGRLDKHRGEIILLAKIVRDQRGYFVGKMACLIRCPSGCHCQSGKGHFLAPVDDVLTFHAYLEKYRSKNTVSDLRISHGF